MVLDWFGRARRANIADLIARKNYKKAIETIRDELNRRRKDRRLRLQLADVLVLAGRKKEAVEVLISLADDLALAGLAAQSIAVLKKIQAMEPGRSEVEEKLVYLIDQQSRPSEDPWAIARRRQALDGASSLEIGMEEFGEGPGVDPLGLGATEAAGFDLDIEAVPDADPGTASPPPETTPETTQMPETALTDDAVRDELVALLEEVLVPDSSPAEMENDDETARESAPPAETLLRSPLFSDFSRDELAAVIRGLSLRSYLAGEIVITEGEPRGSLFVIASGRVRAYVRHVSGRSLPIRDLGEGDFFGEIAILTGKPRSATVTAATRCELLELDRANLDNICRSHPRVLTILQEFVGQRANNTIEAAIRAMQIGGEAPSGPGAETA